MAKYSKLDLTTNNNEILNLEDLEICLFSFNLGDYAKSKYIDFPNVKDDFAKLFIPSTNRIWAICTQEDSSGSKFMNNLIYYFKTLDYQLLTYFGTETDAEVLSIPASRLKYMVKLIVFIPTALSSNITLFSTKLVSHSVLLNKSSLIVSLVIISRNAEPILLSFIGAHLPINTKQDFKLGVDKRIDAMTKTQEEFFNLEKDFVKEYKSKSSHLLFTGDLNFRLEKYGDIKSDQLRNVIESQKLKLNLTDFTPIENIGATCKTISDKYIDNSNENNNTTPLLEANYTVGRNNNDDIMTKSSMTKSRCHDVYLGKNLDPEKISKCYDIFIKKSKIYKTLKTGNNNRSRSNKIKSKLSSIPKLFSRKTKKNNSRTHLLSNYNMVNNQTKYRNNKKIFCKKVVDKRLGINSKSEECFTLLANPEKKPGKSVMRFPSYCDRILGFSNNSHQIELQPVFIETLSLDADDKKLPVRPIVSLGFVSVSDHNPIFGTFKFVIKNGNNSRRSLSRSSSTGNQTSTKNRISGIYQESYV